MGHSPDFQALLARLRGGDPAAAEEVCRRYGPFLRAAVRRHLDPGLRTRFDSLDFVQDVWASFLALPAGRYAFPTPGALAEFLALVARRKVIDARRHQCGARADGPARDTPTGEGADAALDVLPSPAAGPVEWAVAAESWDRLLTRVPAGHRAVLERLRDGYGNAEIARLTGVSLSTVNRIVHRLKDLAGV